ncbi:MAG TPA: hypothetical protein VH502_08625 [Actinoplanes sp.]
MPDVRLAAADALELGQLLDFLADWLARPDGRLDDAYAEFVGHDAADLTDVRDALARYAFLLGADDEGRHLFGDDLG